MIISQMQSNDKKNVKKYEELKDTLNGVHLKQEQLLSGIFEQCGHRVNSLRSVFSFVTEFS
jgi:hypothetical protein